MITATAATLCTRSAKGRERKKGCTVPHHRNNPNVPAVTIMAIIVGADTVAYSITTAAIITAVAIAMFIINMFITMFAMFVIFVCFFSSCRLEGGSRVSCCPRHATRKFSAGLTFGRARHSVA